MKKKMVAAFLGIVLFPLLSIAQLQEQIIPSGVDGCDWELWLGEKLPEVTRKYVVLYSRPGRLYPFSFGHAFVGWREVKNGKVISQTIYGFYPAPNKGSKSLWLEVKGGLLPGYEENRSKSQTLDSVVVWVSDRVFYKTFQQAQKMNDSTYRLLFRNCLTFLHNIANEIGLKTPKLRARTGLPVFPSVYLARLQKKNNGKKLAKRGLRIYEPIKTRRLISRFLQAKRKR
jgi:hypothetical protein